MNKLLKVSTLLLAVAAALPAAAQSPTRVQGEALREQRDVEREQSRNREDGRKPMPAVAQGREGRQAQGRPWDGDGRDRRGDRGPRDGRDHRDDRPIVQHGDYRHGDGRYGDNRQGHDGRRHDDRHRDNRYYGPSWSNGHDRRDWRRDHRDWHRDHRRHASYRFRSPYRYVYPRGYRHYDWRVGYYLPAPFYSHYYYVDYGYYRLPPPPRGYRWIRVDNDVYLVAIGSGLIRDIIYGLFY